MNLQEIAIESLLVESTLSLARNLVQCAEPVKAYRLVTENAPQVALEHPEVRQFAATLAGQIDQAFSDEDYVKRYTTDFQKLYALGTAPKPFADQNMLNLDRAQRTLANVAELVKQKPNLAVLSIGAGDCTLEQRLLQTHPEISMTISELNYTASDATRALQEQFPGRVHVTGRFDLEVAPVDTYDTIVCLEVVEHVREAVLFLTNIRRALAPGGSLLMSTPNSVSWVERLHLDRFGTDNWYQHLRAYTAKSLNDDLVSAGLASLIRVVQGITLYCVCTVLDEAVPSAPVEARVLPAGAVGDVLAKIRSLPPGSVVYLNGSLTQPDDVVVSVINGVVVYPLRLAPSWVEELK